MGAVSPFVINIIKVGQRQFTPLNWPDSDSDFAQVRVSVRVPDPTQSQSQVSLTFQKSEILTRFYKWILEPKS